MIRARIAVVATLVGASLAGTSLLAQTAPEMKPILAGRKVEPPIKGQAEIDFLQPVTKRNGDVVTTNIKVKNTSAGANRAADDFGDVVRQGPDPGRQRPGPARQGARTGRRGHGHHSNAVEREDERQQLAVQPRQRHHQAAARAEARRRQSADDGSQSAGEEEVVSSRVRTSRRWPCPSARRRCERAR